MNTDYVYWQNALAGSFGPVHDGDPQPGFYKRRTDKRGQWVAVAIWRDPDKGIQAIENGYATDADDVWTWVCRSPITETLYRAIERGEPWPDALDKMVGRNSNNPPTDEAEADELQSAIDAALAAVANGITNASQADLAANHRDRLQSLWKAQEAARKSEKAPFDTMAKAVDAKFKPVLARIEEAGGKVKAALTKWLMSEESRIRAEALAKLKAEEAARAEAAAANLPPPAAAPMPEIERPKAGTLGRATALRTHKSAEITDYAKALAHFSQNSEVQALIQTLADRCARADIAVPGCEIKIERKAA